MAAHLIVLLARVPGRATVEEALRRCGPASVAGPGEPGGWRIAVDGGAIGSLTLHEAPLAESALAEVVSAESAAAIARHTGHARADVEMPPGASPLQRLQLLAHLARTVITLPEALALFVPGGRVLTDMESATRSLAPAATPVLSLWVGVRTFELEDASGCFLDTLGMTQLGLPDLETYAGEGAAALTTAAWLRNVARHLVVDDAPAQLRNGDTLDGPDEQPWLTTEDQSTVEPRRPVLRFTPLAPA